MADDILVAGDRVIAADGVIPRGAVLLRDGRIARLGPVSDFDDVRTARRIELPGTSVLPGYIDMHAHASFQMTSPRTPYAEIRDSLEVTAVRAVSFMRAKLRNGVTTARMLSERSHLGSALRDAIDEGRIEGPRLIVAGLGIKSPSNPWGHTATVCGSPAEIRALIRENVAHGARVTKLFVSNNGSAGPDGDVPDLLGRAELEAAMDESHRNGLQVSAHCVGGPSLRAFVEAGGDTVEHGFFLTDEDIALMAERRTWLVATIGYLFDRCDLTGDEEGRAAREVAGSTYLAAFRAGVPIVVGTDDGVDGVGHDLDCLVAAGFQPLDALAAATHRAAECLGRDDIGDIAPGLRGDLVVIDGDPTSGASFDDVVMVVKDGQLLNEPNTGIGRTESGAQ